MCRCTQHVGVFTSRRQGECPAVNSEECTGQGCLRGVASGGKQCCWESRLTFNSSSCCLTSASSMARPAAWRSASDAIAYTRCTNHDTPAAHCDRFHQHKTNSTRQSIHVTHGADAMRLCTHHDPHPYLQPFSLSPGGLPSRCLLPLPLVTLPPVLWGSRVW